VRSKVNFGCCLDVVHALEG